MLGVLDLATSVGELRLQSTDPMCSHSSTTATSRMSSTADACARWCGAGYSSSSTRIFRAIIAERIEPTDAELASDEALNEYLLREVTTGQHISGTCKMGPASDPMAVVDQHGHVHGLQNLRVVDASIMPDCIPGQHQRHHDDDWRAHR